MQRIVRRREQSPNPRPPERHTISRLGGDGVIRLKYAGGLVAEEPIYNAAIAVGRGEAEIVDEQGGLIPPKEVVFCRLSLELPGMIIKVVDPGPGHASYIIIGGMKSIPLIGIHQCRSIGKKCSDAIPSCKGCCNNPKE